MRPGARLAAAVATAVALACRPASAQELRSFYTGNDLSSLCASNGALEAGLCKGYVMGIADAMGTASPILGLRACILDQVTAEQERDVVMRYLAQHPETRHQPAAILATAALAQAFPCKP